jgi:hypothetical protein
MGTKFDWPGVMAGLVLEEDKTTLGLMLEDKEPASLVVEAPGTGAVAAPAV